MRYLDLTCGLVSVQALPKHLHHLLPAFRVARFTRSAPHRHLLFQVTLGMFDKYGFDWYSNDYDLILRNSPYVLHDARTIVHGGYREFNMEILEMMQKHLSREHSEKQ